jgi:dihydroorotase
MKNYLIKNALIVNEGKEFRSDVYIKNGLIEKIGSSLNVEEACEEIVADDLVLMPGVIDDQVHFREPGLTHKAEIATESKAAVAGGTTTFMEMPNVKPPSLSFDLLEEKYAIAAECSPANYSFFMGVSNDNAEEALKINERKHEVCGLKIFMGSSTGNMLVDNYVTLDKIFGESGVLIATHCEREGIIKNNLEKVLATNPTPDINYHPIIRDVDACYESSFGAIQLARKKNTRLHILHISTAKELDLFSNMMPLSEKRITAEVCVHHLHFTANDYEKYGHQIKCNPAIKEASNREALWKALENDTLDIIATDHAPHTWEEKSKDYMNAPSGVPLVQHSLLLMLDYVHQGKISLSKVVEKMCHAPAQCFEIEKRGYIREGYAADLVLLDMKKHTTVTKENLLYKCNWSPFEGHTFSSKVEKTFVNGQIVYNDGHLSDINAGQRVLFSRD